MSMVLKSSLTAVLAAIFLALCPAARAAEAKAPASLQEQLQVLSSALVESFNTGDWEMLELVADGVKAAGLKGPDLEVFVLTSERDAAFRSDPMMGMWPDRNRILVWGLAFRAKLGGEKALAALREKALAKLTPVEQPKPAKGGVFNPEEYKAWSKYQAELAARNTALLALALLGDKDAGAPAWEALQKTDPGAGLGWAGVTASGLVLAVLAAEGEAGWKKLAGFCSPAEGDGAEFGRRVTVLASLAALANTDRPASHAQAFKVEGKLAKTLPADAGATLRAAFVKLAEKLPEAETANFSILFAAGAIPGLTGDEAALQALKSLKGRCKTGAAGQWDKAIDRIISPPPAKQPAAGGPAKPDPVPQKETF